MGNGYYRERAEHYYVEWNGANTDEVIRFMELCIRNWFSTATYDSHTVTNYPDDVPGVSQCKKLDVVFNDVGEDPAPMTFTMLLGQLVGKANDSGYPTDPSRYLRIKNRQALIPVAELSDPLYSEYHSPFEYYSIYW